MNAGVPWTAFFAGLHRARLRARRAPRCTIPKSSTFTKSYSSP